MNIKIDNSKIIDFSKSTLSVLTEIEVAARNKLSEGGISTGGFATINTFNDTNTVNSVSHISNSNFENYQELVNEPAIARIKVEHENGVIETYYITRSTPVNIASCKLASYKSPKGSWAAKSIGDEVEDLKHGIGTLIEKAIIKPTHLIDKNSKWDSIPTLYEGNDQSQITIKSLLDFIVANEATEIIDIDFAAQELREEEIGQQIFSGVRRMVIEKMSLRDQPILDPHQDEIFRMPLNSQLLLLGAAGTGKTTTLIKRLSQKIQFEFLEENELRLVKQTNIVDGIQHKSSWIMFTPNDLLKSYLKEAFARDGVPASDNNIYTWRQYRHELSRNTFNILKSANRGTFIIRDKINYQIASLENQPIAFFEEFNEWQKLSYLKDISSSAIYLSECEDVEASILGQIILKIIEKNKREDFYEIFGEIEKNIEKIQSLIDKNKTEIEKLTRQQLNIKLSQDINFLKDLAAFLPSLEKNSDTDADDIDLDEEEAELIDNNLNTGSIKKRAESAFVQALRTKARKFVLEQQISKASKSSKILEKIGILNLSDDQMSQIGLNSIIVSNLQKLSNPVQRYLNVIPKRYQDFRKERIKDVKNSDISYEELDIVLLVSLRATNEIIKKYSSKSNQYSKIWNSISSKLAIYKNQVLIDECTDFSPIQLACMSAISNPEIGSFFACGDFNQRLTSWGSKTVRDFSWIHPFVKVQEIKIPYRQSRKLAKFSTDVLRISSGNDHEALDDENFSSEGFSPCLISKASEEEAANWVAKRIIEIEKHLGLKPSIAIFVEHEDKVGTFAKKLSMNLQENSIVVQPCYGGQTVGQDSNVRVFDVQHIKGLEFEAVFFINVDKLAFSTSDLFLKYLYVGATRAATFLGLTCSDSLPKVLKEIERDFSQSWPQ